MRSFVGLVFFASLFYRVALADVIVRGRLLERGTRIPLGEVSVYILPHKLKATTDSRGNFHFESVPEGEFQFVVSNTGYERLEKDDFAEADLPARTLYLEKTSYSGFETVIVGAKQKRDQSQKSLKQAEFATLPGAGGDPVKAVQNLPGVNRTGGFSSQVIIQGSAPQDTKYDLDGHDIPLVFHFGGLTSVVMPEAVEQVDYLSAGYGPEYSRAMGGVISLKTRNPDVKDRDRKGFFFIDTLKSGALIEGKINDHSSYLVSGRYSYIGFFLKQAMKDNESFNLTVAPEFSDLTILYQNKLNDRDDLKVDFLASRDTLGFVLKEPVRDDPRLRGNFSNETNFFRLIPQWSRHLDSERTARLSAGIGRNFVSVDAGDIYLRINSWLLTARGEWEQKFSKNWLGQIGFDNQYNRAKVDFRLPNLESSGGIRNPITSSDSKEASVDSRNVNLGLYSRNELQIENTGVVLTPSLRADRFGLTGESVLSPRMAAKWRLSDSFLLKAGTGLYYQPPQEQEVDSTYGNPDVRSPSAIHLTIGAEKDFRDQTGRGYQLSSSLFRRDFRNLVVPSTKLIDRGGASVSQVFSNDGGGMAQGIENQLKFDFLPWTGWISYTFSQSQRWDPAHPVYNFQYDQTHNVNLVGSYEDSHNRKYSFRYRYVTGNPYTPVVSAVFDSDNDVYVPVRGAYYSERQSAFSQLDFRVDKKWILDREVWSIYLDVQNVLNTKNPEQVRYSYDYSQKEIVSGLPILPAFGIKGEF